jgi:hypothetical protein
MDILTTTQTLYVIGPNLRNQSKGSFHVHDATCADVARMAHQDPAYAEELHNGAAHEFNSQVQVAEYVYDNGIMGDDETGADYVHDFHFFPCVTIPATVPGDEIPVGSR